MRLDDCDSGGNGIQNVETRCFLEPILRIFLFWPLYFRIIFQRQEQPIFPHSFLRPPHHLVNAPSHGTVNGSQQLHAAPPLPTPISAIGCCRKSIHKTVASHATVSVDSRARDYLRFEVIVVGAAVPRRW